MFVEAIERVETFTRAIHTISRLYGHSDIIPGSATLFFVNEDACAVTCRHVAELINRTTQIYANYTAFLAERQPYVRDRNFPHQLKRLEEKYGLLPETLIRLRNTYVNCVDEYKTPPQIDLHPTHDLALIRFRNYNRRLYRGHATFVRDSGRIRAGRSLCRLGYPFPEFSNYRYNKTTDDIEWTAEGRITSPYFPIDGIVTRLLHDGTGIVRIEMSTPGLPGQSGGPLFDVNGLIYGMQSRTRHLHLGLDVQDEAVLVKGRRTRVSHYPFLNVGECVHVDVIKAFLREKGVKFYEE